MAAAPSRLERLVKLVGEQNLPPKLSHQGTNKTDPASDESSPPTSQPAPQFAGELDCTKWWEASPQAWAAPSLPKPSQASAGIHSIEPTQTDSHKGKPSPLGLAFTPFIALTKFPYKFAPSEWLQPLASTFFDQGKIWEREWDIYYICSDYSPTAVTFVPEHQFLALISEINEAFPDAKLSVTDQLRDAGLVIDFDEFRGYPDLRPRWLGLSKSRSQYDSWVADFNMTTPGSTGSRPDERTLKAFQEKMQLAIDAGKNKNKTARAKRQAENVVKRQGMAKSLRRAEEYLGFLPAHEEDSLLPNIASLSTSPHLDPTKPSRHPFDMDVIFIAFDVEAYERPPRQVTEIGVATLDTRDLHNAAPGTSGTNWQQFIRARHFRIEEYKNYRNREFVQGCPDKFEFGKSEFIGKNSVGKVVSACFKQPFSGPSQNITNEARNIVILGHDISQDINYLQQVGFNVLNSGQICDKLDTAEMYRVYSRDPNARSLGNIILDFGFPGWNLHNAGNDAVYTIWAFLAICVMKASEAGTADEAQRREADLEKRTEEAVEQAKQKVKEDHEGWEAKR